MVPRAFRARRSAALRASPVAGRRQDIPQDRFYAGEYDLHDPHRARGHFDFFNDSRVARRFHADGDGAQRSVRELKDPVGRGSGLDPRPYEGYRGRINDSPGRRIGDHA